MQKSYGIRITSKKEALKLIIVLTLFITIVTVVVKLATAPKPVASIDQVNDLLSSRGYAIKDDTERYQKGSPTGRIVNVLTVQQEELVFQFFVFEDNNSAMNAYGIITEQINGYRTMTQDVAREGFHGNFIYRSLLANGKYYYLVRVGETLVYASGSESQQKEINNLIASLGYLE